MNHETLNAPLAVCCNCRQPYIDNRPQSGQKLYEVPDHFPALTTGHECPRCRTDSYLAIFEGRLKIVTLNIY